MESVSPYDNKSLGTANHVVRPFAGGCLISALFKAARIEYVTSVSVGRSRGDSWQGRTRVSGPPRLRGPIHTLPPCPADGIKNSASRPAARLDGSALHGSSAWRRK